MILDGARRSRVTSRILAALLSILAATLALPDRAAAAESEATPAVTLADGQITLGEAALAQAGIETVAAAAVSSSTQVQAFGHVLDPLPLVEARQARASARAAATAARAEEKRVARLHAHDQNASTRDLEAADAALQKAEGDAADAAARLATGWGKAAELDDRAVDALVAHRAALVRIDLPSGVHLGTTPASATLTPTGSPETRLEARILGGAPTTDPALQGDAYLALVTTSAPRPGTTLGVTLERAAAPTGAVSVPASAVVWLDAKPVVYVQVATGKFRRSEVTLGPEARGTWRIDAGLAAGEQVVRAGAAQLVSAEVLASEPAEAE